MNIFKFASSSEICFFRFHSSSALISALSFFNSASRAALRLSWAFFWATSALALVLFPIVSFVALWIYSLIFVFAGLWFSHFLLDALKELRQEELDKALTVQSRVVDMELPYHG